MADRNVQIKVRNGAAWDSVYPKTKAAIVVLDDGATTLSSKISTMDTAIAGKATPDDITTAINGVINASPATLDTLNELAQALGDDANFATTVANSLALKAPLASPTLTGTPAAPTAAVDTTTTQLATTAFVVGQAASVAPVMDGVATVGTSKKFARQDHIHPADTSKAPLANPALTGAPTAPTAAAATNTTQIATTAFVKTAVATLALGVPIISTIEPTTSDLWYQEI